MTKRNVYYSLNGDVFGVRFGIYPDSVSHGNIYEAEIELKEDLSADSLTSVRTDYDENGKWLMYCSAEFDKKTEIIIAVYENNTCIGYEVIDDIANINDAVVTLKEKTNWHYNCCHN